MNDCLHIRVTKIFTQISETIVNKVNEIIDSSVSRIIKTLISNTCSIKILNSKCGKIMPPSNLKLNFNMSSSTALKNMKQLMFSGHTSHPIKLVCCMIPTECIKIHSKGLEKIYSNKIQNDKNQEGESKQQSLTSPLKKLNMGIRTITQRTVIHFI